MVISSTLLESDSEDGKNPTNNSIENIQLNMIRFLDFSDHSQLIECKIFIEYSMCREHKSR
jgi:hypothetical protein